MSYGKSLLLDCVFHCTYKDIVIKWSKAYQNTMALAHQVSVVRCCKNQQWYIKKTIYNTARCFNKEYFPTVSRSKARVSCGGFHN